MTKKCTCGRSTTGDCLGWHDLSTEEYQRIREEYEVKENADRHEKKLLNE